MRTKLFLVLLLLSLNMISVNSENQVVSDLEVENHVISETNEIANLPVSSYIQQTISPISVLSGGNSELTTPTISKRSYTTKPLARIGLDATTQDYTGDYDQQIIITGVLQDGVGTLWTFTQVDLIIDAVPTQIVDTDGSGVFTFTLNFVYADIGNHNYIVNFTNAESDEFRVPGIIKSGNIDLFDIVTPTITTDKVTVGLLQTFTISYKLVNDIGGDIDANSVDGLSTDFTITSSDPSHSPPQIGTNTSVAFVAGFAKITYTAPFASNDYILTISVVINSASALDPAYSHINFASAPASINVNVAALLVFTYTATIGGSAIDPNAFYTRGAAVNIQILGSIDDPNAVGLAVDNRAYTISVSGGGSIITDTNDVTDGFGDFTFNLLFSKTNFDDPNEDIIITITFADANIQPQTDDINIKIEGIFGSFGSPSSTPAAVVGQITNFMYWPNGENTIAVSGNVLDEDGFGIVGIDVDINLNTKSAINNPWAGIINEQINKKTTGAGGAFSHTITIPDIGYNIAWLTVNFTLNPTTKWIQPASDVTFEILSFMYLRSITVTVSQDSEGAAVVNTGTTTFDKLNDTFDGYTSGVAKYDILYEDEWFRTPLGVTYDATITQYNALGSIIGTSITQLDATAGNSATFQIPFSDFRLLTDYNIHILKDATKYSVTIIIADRNTNLPVSTYTEEFILFGPDDVDPAILNINVGGANTGVEDNITIVVNLDYTKSALDNIRSVTLYYWLSDNQVDLSGDATFTGDYTTVPMNYYPVLFNYNYTIPFDDHGTWVRWYVEVLDKAGQGLLLNGNTQTAGAYGWDDAFSNVGYFNGKNSVTPNLDKMGDTDIAQIDLTTAVRVNGDLLLDSSNVTIGDLILISIDLPNDPSLYSDIAIWYRIRTYDPETGEVISSTAYQRIDLTFDVDLGVALRYFHLFNTTDLGMDWFTQLDYYFDYTDVPGNNHVTQAISTLFDADPNDVKETWVNDEIAPTGDFNQTLFEENLINDTKIGVNEYEIYNNTESVYVSYNVTDIGSGIKHVNVTIFLYTTLGNGTVIYTPYTTFTMVLDGEIVYNFTSGLQLNEVVGTYYFVEFEIPTTLFTSNNNVTWTIYVVDNANTITKLNDQDGIDPVQLIIIDSPVIIGPSDDAVDLTTSEIVINGSTFQTVVEVDEGTSNATWIVFGFIAGLAVLIAYYQRHNIGEVLDRRRRKSQAEGTLRDLMDEIYRLGAEGKYKRAILLSWEALERVTREIIQTPRKYFQTAREFTDFLSTVTIVERETLLTLSDAFEAARYGKDKPSSDDLDDAVNALKIIVDTIIQSGARVKFDEDDDF